MITGKEIIIDVTTHSFLEREIIIPPPSIEEVSIIINTKINRLWQAAHDYEYQYISGSAIGLLTVGVLQSKPKCLAVKSWINSIWDIYYIRKALVTVDSMEDIDFSSCGPIPYSVPELIMEVGL